MSHNKNPLKGHQISHNRENLIKIVYYRYKKEEFYDWFPYVQILHLTSIIQLKNKNLHHFPASWLQQNNWTNHKAKKLQALKTEKKCRKARGKERRERPNLGSARLDQRIQRPMEGYGDWQKKAQRRRIAKIAGFYRRWESRGKDRLFYRNVDSISGEDMFTI